MLPVAVDAMGGDHAPAEIVAGARQAHEEDGVPVLLVGRSDELADVGDLEVLEASEVIAMDAEPGSSVRRMKDSSLVRAAEAVRDGKEKACVLNEPWISVAEKWGMRILIESHSTRSEAAGDELDGETLAKMFKAQARAAEAIQNDPEKYAHYLIEETGGLLEDGELKLSRILNAPPVPYTRERFDDNYNWTKDWGLVPEGATFDNTVDNRAWS